MSIVIVDYDPAWAKLFEAERARILDAIGQWVTAVEHVGSTAVPGLAAKPIIDILIGIPRLEDAVHTIAPLERLGYTYLPEYEDEMPERRYFRKGGTQPTEPRTHHIHMVEPGTEFWERHLLFRDYLRAHPEDAATYGDLKRRLAVQYAHDRNAYTDAKTGFVQRIEAKARALK